MGRGVNEEKGIDKSLKSSLGYFAFTSETDPNSFKSTVQAQGARLQYQIMRSDQVVAKSRCCSYMFIHTVISYPVYVFILVCIPNAYIISKSLKSLNFTQLPLAATWRHQCSTFPIRGLSRLTQQCKSHDTESKNTNR